MPDLNQNLRRVRVAIDEACRAHARDPDAVQLLAVSKGQPIAAIRDMAGLGQRAFGENYVQEGLSKIEALADLRLEWHFIGRLQSNKAALVAAHFDVCQSVDRPKLVEALARARRADQPPLQVLLQVNVDGEAGKGGVNPAQLPALARLAGDCPTLRLRGLMAIPEPHPDPTVRRQAFERLATLQDQLRAAHPGLDTLSMGMSDDFPEAIAAGSTLVRVGTALFGPRGAGVAG